MTNELRDFIKSSFPIVIAIIFGGTGLYILFNYSNNIVSVIGGLLLIGLAIAIIFKVIENG
nr:hypothetical protein [Candidatus Woesearchaeota archaeon]